MLPEEGRGNFDMKLKWMKNLLSVFSTNISKKYYPYVQAALNYFIYQETNWNQTSITSEFCIIMSDSWLKS